MISDFCVCIPSVHVGDVQTAPPPYTPPPTPFPLNAILLLISVAAVLSEPHTLAAVALREERHSFALVLVIFPSLRTLSHTSSQRQSPDTYTEV